MAPASSLRPRSPDDEPRPLRADARRNRERIVTAARAVFSEQGREAQMDDVARRAGVGVGTVYRHFPTKDALIEGLVTAKFERLELWAQEALEVEDPWAAFEQMMWRSAEQMARDRTLFQVLSAEPELVERIANARVGLTVAMAEVMRRAQAAGALRADIRVEDIGPVMCGVGGAMQMCMTTGGDWKRFFGFVIDGLRA
jgi:AcrR family transcriptional regulator